MIKTQYITDDKGNITGVILPIDEYKNMLSELEDIEDVRLYDEAKKEDDGERISLSDYLKSRKVNA